ncbi:DUF4260 family protein [Segetibacter sp. 3557_3]|uniref:DUF4260 domain-containing protein n=1 Tax=Segetibacter sp. 3557_3 TaxID=2547429 RepID=UPI00105882C3|nr:DUF4260 domain-containing protein [Segetibacter sp. 3557_3]TDH24565.1 DUF4260 family protein [Segetibacter sp. 3557_3]
MKTLIKVEEIAQFCAAILGLYLLPFRFEWYIWPVLFLLPDISMLGYLWNSRVGAVCYNLFHHKGTAILLLLAGWFLTEPTLVFVGVLLYGHSAFDRMMGYGLKLSEGFKYTHLGIIGKEHDADKRQEAAFVHP